MSNECQRIIMQHAPVEIPSILQIKENISIRRQTLTYAGGAWSLYISFQNYNIQEGTGKVIYKPSNLMKNSSISNRIDREAIKMPSSLGV